MIVKLKFKEKFHYTGSSVLRKMFILCTFLQFFNSFVFSEITPFDNSFKELRLNSISFFQGDLYEDFKNNFVAHLNDGSAWKIHPEDQTRFNQWNINDIVHIYARTSFYWFKREHKFEICNQSRQETIRAMLVKYPEPPLRIVESESHISGYYMDFYTTTDAFGNIQYHYYPIYTYATTLWLSDASQWDIDEYCHFHNEEKIYIFLDRKNCSFILITAIERQAQWKKAMFKSF